MNAKFNEMMNKMNKVDSKKWMTHLTMFGILALVCMVTLMPESALAAKAAGTTGFGKIEGVFSKFLDFITGPVARIIAIAGMICVGIVYIFARQDMSEGFKMLLQTCFGICFIVFATTIVDGVFSLSALL